MAKIQLVIEIEERLYKNIIDNDMDDEKFEAIDDAFWNAKPLPKGHGDLIDRKELLKQPMDLANYPSNYVRIAPPIIEADTESEK